MDERITAGLVRRLDGARCNATRDAEMLEERAIFQRELQQLVTSMQVKLVRNVRPVVIDSLITKEHFRRNLPAGFVFGNESQDLPLRRSQQLYCRVRTMKRLDTITSMYKMFRENGTHVKVTGSNDTH